MSETSNSRFRLSGFLQHRNGNELGYSVSMPLNGVDVEANIGCQIAVLLAALDVSEVLLALAHAVINSDDARDDVESDFSRAALRLIQHMREDSTT